jgi:hypothetical protein
MTMTVNQGIRYDAIDPIIGMPSSGGFRRLIQIVLGLSIAFAASSFFSPSFNPAAERRCDGTDCAHRRLLRAGPSRADRTDR